MKYQIVVNRELLGYGQFVTEGRDEVNTTIIKNQERPFIFASKLRAVERRTIMKRVRKVLNINCFLEVHKKADESGISGLCLSCPACWLFGGTFAPGERKVQVNERTKVSYSDAYPLKNVPIEDKTFNAVDEKESITGQALGVNQIIGPGGNFINVIDVDVENEDWVKLVIWGIEHSDRYGANVRIYGQMRNEILGVIKSDKLEISSWELANKFEDVEGVKKYLQDTYGKDKLIKIEVKDEDIDKIIKKLNETNEVNQLKSRMERARRERERMEREREANRNQEKRGEE